MRSPRSAAKLQNLVPGVTLRPRRARTLLYAAISALFVIVSLTIAPHDLMRVLALVFFGAGTVMLTTNALPGAWYLRVFPDHLESRVLFRSRVIRRADVAAFGVYRMNGRRWVGFRFAHPYRAQRLGARLNRATTRYDGYLPAFDGVSVEELAARLNDWLRA